MAEPSALSDHLASLPGDEWAVWRWAGLRSAGFPVRRVLDLADPECAAAADRCLDADGPSARADLERSFAAAVRRTADRLSEVAADPRFREAVTWQNRHAVCTGLDVLLARGAGARTSKHRQKEALVASYLQRYCAKNDTIGFFGPMGWARVVEDGPLLRARPGPALLAARDVDFEGWAIDALAEAVAGDPALRPWLVPRLMPFLHVEGRVLHVSLAPDVRLSEAHTAVLGVCDGRRTAQEVAARLAGRGVPGLEGEGDVLRALEELADARRIAWRPEVGAEGLHPERRLRRLLLRVGDPRLREPALGALDELEERRAAVAAAAGDPAKLNRSLADLDSAFTRLTGAAAIRRDGETYAGRTLVYEDCRRDVVVDLGPDLLRTLGPPLSLLLASARWFTWEAARRYRRAFREVFARLAAASGAGPLPLAALWLHAHPLLFSDESAPVAELRQELHARWRSILPLHGGERRAAFRAAALAGAVRDAFAVPGPGWPAARHHSPDVMIAAVSPEAAGRGAFQYVLGEVHPGVNTLRSAFFVGQHPCPEQLALAAGRDLPGPQVVLLPTREPGGATPRMSNGLVSPRDWRLVFAHDSCQVPPDRALPVGSLVVEDAGETLVVATRDGRLRLDVMEVLGELVMFRLVDKFDILALADRTPRVSIDRLVVARERWRFAATGLTFAWHADEASRYLQVRRWKRNHQLPRFVFVRAATERKPFFMDLDSPVSVDVLARVVRRAAGSGGDAAITVTEMLPEPTQAWLADAGGRRYTSELRLVAVDRRSAGAPRP